MCLPKGCQNCSKMGAKSGPGETVKTVLPSRRELTLALQAGCKNTSFWRLFSGACLERFRASHWRLTGVWLESDWSLTGRWLDANWCFGGVPKRDLKKYPLQDQEKWDLGTVLESILETFVWHLYVTFVLPLCYLCVTFWLLLAPILEQFWHPFGRLHDFPERGSGTFTERSLNVH